MQSGVYGAVLLHPGRSRSENAAENEPCPESVRPVRDTGDLCGPASAVTTGLAATLRQLQPPPAVVCVRAGAALCAIHGQVLFDT